MSLLLTDEVSKLYIFNFFNFIQLENKRYISDTNNVLNENKFSDVNCSQWMKAPNIEFTFWVLKLWKLIDVNDVQYLNIKVISVTFDESNFEKSI